jgi:hypothetical protein
VLYVDKSNNRVGINDATPSYSLDVTGTANITGAVTLGSTLAVAGASASISPASGNAALNISPTSGTASANIKSTSGNASLTLTGASGDAFFALKKDGAEQSNNIIGYKGADIRWQLLLGDNTADNGGGSNAGSDFAVYGYSDAGVSITSLVLSRKFDTLTYSGAMSADSFTPSDRRLKDEIAAIPDALWKLGQLTGCTFVRTDKRDRPRMAGVIAQDVQAVLPEAVHTHGETGMLSVSDAGVIGLLVEAVKELRAEVVELRSRLEGEP